MLTRLLSTIGASCAIDQSVTLVGREPAPDSELFSVADRVTHTLTHDITLRANGFGLTLTPQSGFAGFAVDRKEDGGILVATPRLRLPRPQGVGGDQ